MSCCSAHSKVGYPSCFGATFLFMLVALGWAFSAGPISAKTTLQATDFEALPVLAGGLSPTFTTIVAGPSSVAIGTFAPNDPVQGVVASSVLGTGHARAKREGHKAENRGSWPRSPFQAARPMRGLRIFEACSLVRSRLKAASD